MPLVHLLDKSVYELIAAGEVIERPSSVVKELMENSIDAGATSITVEIKNGGRTYIRVTDNGDGIAPDDIQTAFMRHATSKISTGDDLNSIETLGFRGEALASICAVSKVEVLTRQMVRDYGIHYCNEGGTSTVYEDSGCPVGTTMIVRELFYNVPARLKFLKRDVGEGNAVAGIVSKLALSHPEIAFRFIRDNRSDIVTSGDGKLLSAIYAVLGSEFHDSVVYVNYSLNGVSVTGYVTKPLLSKGNRSFQNFFVNNRYVKSVTCMVALEEAYRNMIMTGKFPGCVLMIDVDPSCTDVNVHPAKLEIRFNDEKPIYDAVFFGVKNALMTYDGPMEAEINVPNEPSRRKELSYDDIMKKPASNPEQISFSSVSADSTVRSIGLGGLDNPVRQAAAGFIHKGINPDYSYSRSNESKSSNQESGGAKFNYKFINSEEKSEPVSPSSIPVKEEVPIRAIGEIFKTYILAEVGEDMYIIDKHAAHERYNFERLKSGEAQICVQTLLNPVTVSLSYEGHAAASENLRMLMRFGFNVEVIEAPKVKLYGIPILLTDEDPADLLVEAADHIANCGTGDVDKIFDDLFHSVACKASIKANSTTSLEELDRLVKLIIEKDLRYCPHGRPISVKLSKRELEKLFKRIV